MVDMTSLKMVGIALAADKASETATGSQKRLPQFSIKGSTERSARQ